MNKDMEPTIRRCGAVVTGQVIQSQKLDITCNFPCTECALEQMLYSMIEGPDPALTADRPCKKGHKI